LEIQIHTEGVVGVVVGISECVRQSQVHDVTPAIILGILGVAKNCRDTFIGSEPERKKKYQQVERFYEQKWACVT